MVGLGGIEVQVLKGEGLHATRAVELGQLAEVHRQDPKYVNLNLEVVLINIQLGRCRMMTIFGMLIWEYVRQVSEVRVHEFSKDLRDYVRCACDLL